MNANGVDNGPMLNAYPDSIGGTLSDMVHILQKPEWKGVFSSFYILPSVFNTDLDRGFSVIDYGLNELLAEQEDLAALNDLNIDLKLDFVLNHASVLSPQFQDILLNGEESRYKDFFINWNTFWEGHGEMTEMGYIQPEGKLIENMFFRKPGLPVLMVRMPDGKKVPYWNTFYQEIKYGSVEEQDLMQSMQIQYASAVALAELINKGIAENRSPQKIELGRYEGYRAEVEELLESRRKYLGQMDLNIKSPLVWDYYEDTLRTLAEYGAGIVRLDAVAYASKEPGEKNFLNDPGTWELLDGVRQLADKYQLELLPEIHASYEEGIYKKIAEKGYLTYDFFLPGLIIDAMEHENGEMLARWAKELYSERIRMVNMLGCHDGIPLLDLKGLLPEERIQSLIDAILARGGVVKDLHGQKNVYYQVNSTYYSALGENDKKMLLARAIQLFMPGKPQIWYLDLFAGKNDYEAVRRAGAGGHKEINRTNLSLEEIEQRMQLSVVQKQIQMLQFRNSFPAFGFEAELQIKQDGTELELSWRKSDCCAVLSVDFASCDFEIKGIGVDGIKFHMKN